MLPAIGFSAQIDFTCDATGSLSLGIRVEIYRLTLIASLVFVAATSEWYDAHVRRTKTDVTCETRK